MIILNSNYSYIKNPKDYKGKWQEVFGNSNPICLEIGSGKCRFIIEMAKRYPNINFIGMERSSSVLALGFKNNNICLPNLKFICENASLVMEIFDREIDTLYLNFSDPWPKARHCKRRLTHSNFLSKYDYIFKDNCRIVFKTDNQELFLFSLVSLTKYGYFLDDVNLDLQKIKNNDNIVTEYEEKFAKLGCKIYRLIAQKNKKSEKN